MNIDKKRLVFRRATINDIDTIIENRIEFLNEMQGKPSPGKEPRVKKSLEEYFKKSLIDETFISWIAEYDHNAVGFSGMVIREQPGNFEIPDGKTGYILNMFTIKKFRNNGICKVLFQKLIEDARSLNLNKIELHATEDGEPVYKQFGFSEPHDKALEIILK